MPDSSNPAAGPRRALILIAAVAGLAAPYAGAGEPSAPRTAPLGPVTAAEIAPRAVATPEPVLTRRADGSMSVRPGERFVEYVVAGRDSSARVRLRCVRGHERVNLALRTPAPWLKPRAVR